MTDIQGLLGDEADSLLTHVSKGIPKDDLTLPGADIVDRVYKDSDRSPQVLRNLQALFGHGRLAGTGLRVDPPGRPGHRALGRGVVRAQPEVLRPEEHRRAGHRGRLQRRGLDLRRARARARAQYAHKIPFIVKINHNELLTYPNEFDQIMFGSVEQAYDLGAAGVGATIYFGSPESHRQIIEVSEAFARAHELGMFTVLWCYLRNNGFKVDGVDYHAVGRPHRPGQPPRRHHRGRHHQAEAADQQRRLQRPVGLRQDRRRSSTASSSPTTRSTWPAGRSPTATWAASGSSTPAASPRAPATSPTPSAPRSSTSGPAAPGLISGRKAFQRPTSEGVELLNAIQDVYLDDERHRRLIVPKRDRR